MIDVEIRGIFFRALTVFNVSGRRNFQAHFNLERDDESGAQSVRILSEDQAYA